VVNPTFILGPVVTTEVRSSLQLTKMMLDGRMPAGSARSARESADRIPGRSPAGPHETRCQRWWRPGRAGVNMTGLLLTVVGYSTHSPGLHLGWLLLDRLARGSVDPLLMQQARP
jgi:hypothetical protein